jgi:putative membrane protein
MLLIAMNLSKPEKAILGFTALYTVAFAAFYIRQLNIEFIGYVGVIIFIFALLYGTLDKTRIPVSILAGISLWGLLHMMGGSIQTEDGVLYAWKIYPFFDGGGEFYILQFDQVVHGYLYAVVALLFLHLLRNYFGNKHSQILVGFIAVAAALGVSALNEILEFIAVLTVPDNGVGGYFNLALDMVFNLAGALIGVLGYYLFIHFSKLPSRP